MELKLNPYSDLEEISIQDEIISFISGEDFGEQKNTPHIHRALRRDKYNEPIKCTCWDKVANEGVDGCPYCDGVGFYWDESIIPGIIFLLNKRKLVSAMSIEVEAGRKDDYEMAFICPYNINMVQRDGILIPHMTNQGMIKYPVEIDQTYYIVEVVNRRLDHSRKEYSMSIISRTV